MFTIVQSVAKWQRQLDDPTSAEEEKREHLKQKITHYESFIQAYRKDILDCEAEIQKLTDAIERTGWCQGFIERLGGGTEIFTSQEKFP